MGDYLLATYTGNKAIKYQCVHSCSALEILFFQYGSTAAFLAISSIKYGVYYYRLAYMQSSQADLTAYN